MQGRAATTGDPGVFSEDHHELSKELLDWYDSNRRTLPWRRTSDPYRIWVSEVMLTQTRVEAVIPYYLRFLERFPTLRALADASLDDVLRVWEGLGYYARARNLHSAARRLRDQRRGELPDVWEDWIRLPGVGPYIAGAVLSIAYGQAHPAVDGNARRVLTRLFCIREDTTRSPVRRYLSELARGLIPPGRPGAFNQALMELGALICAPRLPRCSACPVERFCCAQAEGVQSTLPLRRPRKPTPHYEEVAGVVLRTDRLLIAQRAHQGLLGGLWEFPGGRARSGEEPIDALVRILVQEWDLRVDLVSHLTTIEHAYTHFSITLHAHSCRHTSGCVPSNLDGSHAWVSTDQLTSYPFSVAQRKIARLVPAS